MLNFNINLKENIIDLKPRIIGPEEMYARRAELILSLALETELEKVVREKAKEIVNSIQQCWTVAC